MVRSNIKKEFHCDIEKIWNIITDNYHYSWRSDLSKIDVVDETHFIEYTKSNFPTYFTITSKKKLKEYQFDIQNTNIKGKWIGVFTCLDDKTVLLDLEEEIETTHFIMKIFAKPYLKKMQKRYIKDLEKQLYK